MTVLERTHIEGDTGNPWDPKWDDIDHAIFDARIRQGKTWRTIAGLTGLSHENCRQRFWRKVVPANRPEVEEWRYEELERLDVAEEEAHEYLMRFAVWVDANPPVSYRDWAHIDTIRANNVAQNHRRAMFRAKITGIESPRRVEVPAEWADIFESWDRFDQGYMKGAADATSGG